MPFSRRQFPTPVESPHVDVAELVATRKQFPGIYIHLHEPPVTVGQMEECELGDKCLRPGSRAHTRKFLVEVAEFPYDDGLFTRLNYLALTISLFVEYAFKVSTLETMKFPIMRTQSM